jgi:hypothetical protein
MKRAEVDNEMIVTIGEKPGMMPRAYYEKISQFIVETLESQESVPFIGLLEQAQQNFATSIRGNLSWYLLYVKQDLEARKIIAVERDPLRAQWIRLKRRYKDRLGDLKLRVVFSDDTSPARSV